MAEGQVGIFQKGYDDQQFILEPGSLIGNFRLYAPATDRVITAQVKENRVRNYPAHLEKYEDQYFPFLLEDTAIDRVEYNVADSKPIGTRPQAFTVSLTNKADATVELTADMRRSISETASFEYQQGYTISIGASFKAGIPEIAEGEVRTDVGTSTDFTWGRSSTVEKQVGSSVKVPVPRSN